MRYDPTLAELISAEPWPTIIEALEKIALACCKRGLPVPSRLTFPVAAGHRLAGLVPGGPVIINTAGGPVEVGLEPERMTASELRLLEANHPTAPSHLRGPLPDDYHGPGSDF